MSDVFDNINSFGVLQSLNAGPLVNLLSSPLNVFNNTGSGVFVLCFDESTEILCLNINLEEVYVPISQLNIGSIVKSFKHGYRKIALIDKGTLVNNTDNFHSCMFVLPKNEYMTKDLIVTGGHSILVDSMSEKENTKNLEYFDGKKIEIDGKQLLLSSASDKFIALQDTKEYTYYHFVLENDGDDDARYGVWANGVLTETPSKRFWLEVMVHNGKLNV